MAEQKHVNLEGRKLFVGIPTYDGKLSIKLAYALAQLMPAAMRLGVSVRLAHVSGCSIITMARNRLVDEFLKTDCTELLFIDSDVIAQTEDILRLMAQSGDKDITAGSYPRRSRDKMFFMDLYFNENNELEFDGAMMRIKRVGTGFMLIRRDVFEKLKPHVGWYKNGGVTINPEDQVYDFFKVQNVNHELLSEDYNFCHLYREHGGTIWAAPWCVLGHFGAYLFSGQYAQQGALNGTPLHQVSA